jgi:integrase
MSLYTRSWHVAWIAQVPPSPRQPKPRWQVRYQDGRRQRSAGIYHTPKAAEAVRKRIERGLPPTLEVLPTDVDAAKAQTLFGDYVTNVWWPTWKAQHPDSAYQTGKRIEKRILPFFGHLPFAALDADRVGVWKAGLAGSGLKPASVNSYLSPLGSILNAAVDSGYLPHSPLMRKSRAGRAAVARNLPVDRREVWVTRGQLDLLAQAITALYRALVVVAALTGMRWGELAALRWNDVHLDKPLDDGAVAGPGRLRVVRAVSDPSRCGRDRRIKGPKSQASQRIIALDQETSDTLRQHQEAFADEQSGLVFTTPGGSRGPGGALTANNFRRVWLRALKQAGLDGGWPEYGGLHFHDLRHTHATWLLALRVPMIAVSARLGHASPVITMMTYAHVDRQVDRGLLTAEDLGLTTSDDDQQHGRPA